MKITVTKDELRATLTRIQNIADKGTTTPILSHFLLTAKGEKVSIRATDKTVGIRGPMNAKVVEEGQICAPVRKLLEIVKEIEEGEITLESKEPEWLRVVTFGKGKFKLACLPVKDFPSWPRLKDEQTFSLKAGEIVEILEKTTFCIGGNVEKYALNGLLFHLKPAEKQLAVVGTDGHRMAYISKDVVAEGEEKKIIVPRKVATELRKFIDDAEAIVTTSFTANQILFKIGEFDFLGRLIEGQYPNYSQVIPQDNGKKVIIAPSALTSSLRKTMILTREGSPVVMLDITPQTMSISTTATEVGEANDIIDVEYAGDPFKISFNPGLLLDAASAFEKSGEEKITLSFDQPMTPALMTKNGGRDYLCLIMPIRP